MKRQNFKRLIALSTVLIMTMNVTGCDQISGLLGNKAADEITDVMSDYMDQIISGKYSKAAKLLKDSDDDELVGASDEMDSDHQALLDAYIAATEYSIDDADAEKNNKGSLKLTITVPDIEDALENTDESGVDALIDSLGDADTVDETFTIKFTYDDEWLINDVSSLESFYIDNVEDVSFSNLTEEAALEYINTAMDAICSGDFQSAYEYLNDEGMTFDEYVAEQGLEDSQVELMSTLFANMTYTSEVSEVGDDYIDVTVNMTAPDLEAVSDTVFDDDFVARMYAYFLFGGDDASDLASADMIETFESGINSSTATISGTMVVRVTETEEGELDSETIERADMFDFEIDGDSIFDPNANSEDYIMPALDYALDSGLISLDEYEEFVAQLNGEEGDDPVDVDVDDVDYGESSITIDSDSDFWRMYFYNDADFSQAVDEYHVGDPGIYFDAGTWDYYYDGEVMTVDIYFNGEYSSSFTIGTAEDYSDRAYGEITSNDNNGLPAGVCTLEITGFNGEHYATVTIVIGS